MIYISIADMFHKTAEACSDTFYLRRQYFVDANIFELERLPCI